MKKIILPALLAFSVLVAPAMAGTPSTDKATVSSHKAADKTFKLQTQLSTLGWVGKKVTGQHNGNVQFKEGTVVVRGNQIVGGMFTVDMNSLKIEDIKDAETNGKLMGHLRSDDFFSIDKNPTATFNITKVTPIKADAAGNNATITGDLTIKGITKPVTLRASFVGAGPNTRSKKLNFGFRATGAINRSDFGLGMAAPAVSDRVDLEINAAFEQA